MNDKEVIKKLKLFIKYFPDILFLIGVLIASYNILKPPRVVKYGLLPELPTLSGIYIEDYTNYKVLGIILVAIAIDIAVRRYFLERTSLFYQDIEKVEII